MALYNDMVLKVFKLKEDPNKEGTFDLKKLLNTIKEDKYFLIVKNSED